VADALRSQVIAVIAASNRQSEMIFPIESTSHLIELRPYALQKARLVRLCPA
jgi:hypothetical protein